MRGRNVYRMLLVLPYAMPAFAMLLVWRDMFNTDFGLINNFFGIDVDWFGQAGTARLAVLLVQLWLGYPYMFLVTTGALQAIPRRAGRGLPDRRRGPLAELPQGHAAAAAWSR